jgi:hypothetical protein
MYLSKHVYVQNWAHHPPERRWKISAELGGQSVKLQLPVTYLIMEAAYWRKANAIHKWFVDHCQDGRDECQESYVERDKLKELLELCRRVLALAKTEPGDVVTGISYRGGTQRVNTPQGKVIANAAEIAELLPATSGFFFGSTAYDEGYLDDIESTVKQLTKALTDPLEGEFYYRASW